MDHSPGFLKLVEDAKSRVREVSVEEARRKVEQGRAKLIDVREESEWGAGHVRGAQHLGKGIIERDIEKRIPDKNAEIVLYCGGGFRSALSADVLQRMGYTNVASMAGGWRAWQEAGGSVAKDVYASPWSLFFSPRLLTRLRHFVHVRAGCRDRHPAEPADAP